jgi:hypothetical protein
MVSAILCFGAMLASQAAPYDPGRHAGFLDQRFTLIRETIRKLDAKKIEVKVAVERLGKTLGECRRLQPQITEYMNKQSGNSTRVLRLIQAQGLFEAYLSSEILALDGDAESKSLGKVLELRLAKAIPLLGK